jgi:hypothetical protein
MRFFLLLMLSAATPVAAQKVEAKMDCAPAAEKLVYDCLIRLARDGKPLSGAQISVGADMPSMPMAHSVRPVKARAGKLPGEYLAKLEIEMHGDWAVKLRLSGPVRDQLVLHYRFTESGATMSDHRRRQP